MTFSQFCLDRGKNFPSRPGFKPTEDRVGRCANDLARAWGSTLDKLMEEYEAARKFEVFEAPDGHMSIRVKDDIHGRPPL